MKTAIILHGMPPKEEYFDPESPSPSNKYWLPWLQRHLILNGVLAQAIELPEPYEPVYEKWCSVFEQFHVDKETMLVGHSCGAGFLVRWLSENKINVGKVALVAPYLDSKHELETDFFHFSIDEDVAQRTVAIKIFSSKDDDDGVIESTDLFRKRVKDVLIEEFVDRGHFTYGDMKTEQFPELLEFLIAEQHA